MELIKLYQIKKQDTCISLAYMLFVRYAFSGEPQFTNNQNHKLSVIRYTGFKNTSDPDLKFDMWTILTFALWVGDMH